jgi:excisionase family DNA binding protein
VTLKAVRLHITPVSSTGANGWRKFSSGVAKMSGESHKMDENTTRSHLELGAEGTIPARRNGSRHGAEQGLPSSRLHGKARGSVVSRESSSGGNSMSRLLSVEEVASLLNVPQKWVYRRVGLKPPEGIPYLKVGKYLRFRESDLWDYVERLRRN